MKIEVIKGKIGDHGVGEVIEADDKAADRLIKLGYAKISNDEAGNSESKPPHNELGAEIGAAQRQLLVNKAVEAKLGTAEEVAKLSNKELKALLNKNGGGN
jgi:hypothetical protein